MRVLGKIDTKVIGARPTYATLSPKQLICIAYLNRPFVYSRPWCSTISFPGEALVIHHRIDIRTYYKKWIISSEKITQ